MITWVKSHFKPLFFLLLAMLFMLANKMQSDRELLNTPAAPHGILNIQLSNSFSTDTTIRGEWNRKKVTRLVYLSDSTKNETTIGLGYAKSQTNYDYGFSVVYVLFLSLLLIKLDSGFVSWLAALAGLLNIIADWQELQLFNYRDFSVLIIYYASVVKWILILGILLYLLFRLYRLGLLKTGLQRIAVYLSFIFSQGLRFRIVVSGLLVIFVLLYAVDQGQDLLLTINYSRIGAGLFMAAISIWALLNWYLPKLYDEVNAATPIKITNLANDRWNYQTSPQRKKDFVRILGAATFLVPAICLLSVMGTFHIRYWLEDISPLLLAATVIVFYYQAARYDWIENWFRSHMMLKLGATLLVVLSLMVYWGFLSKNDHKPYYLAFLSIDFFLLSFVFILITTLRDKLAKLPGLGWLADGRINLWVWLPGLICFLIFLYGNAFPLKLAFSSENRYFTLPFVITALVFYNVFFSVLILIGRKYKMQLISMLFILGFGLSIFSSHFHDVRLAHHPQSVRAYDSLENYTQGWLQKRKADILAFHQRFPADTFPVYIVNTYGGGIRASAWTGFVIDRLDSLLKAADKNPQNTMLDHDIQHYIFAYSGASGGTIGASVLCAARYAHQEPAVMNHDTSYYANDYLTPVLAGLFGRDIWAAASATNFYNDREGIQEETWQLHSATFKMNYGNVLADNWKSSAYEVPLLFSNTFDEERGRKGIAAPVKLKATDFPGAIMVEDLINNPNDEMRLSTAAFMSARFPFVSPTGKLSDQHFSDGGNVENSGAETARGVRLVLQRVLMALSKNDPATFGRVKVIMISLPNSLPGAADEGQAKTWFELSAPLTGLLNTIDGNAYKEDLTNRLSTTTGGYGYFQVAPTLPKRPVNGGWPVYPLGWQISSDALKQMRNSLQQNQTLALVFKTLRP
jgi:hypothetical protein